MKYDPNEVMPEFTEEEAIALANLDPPFYEGWTDKQIARFQFNQPKLCMNFGRFHEAVEKALGRPVWTHEFAMNYEGMKAELNGEAGPPTFQEILDLIPEDKRVIVILGGKDD